MKPTLLMNIGFLVMIALGVIGEIHSWTRIGFRPYSHFIGGAVFVAGFLLHRYCHKTHTQAHDRAQKIEGIIKTGPFATIRHPLYLSLIVMFFGLAVGWGVFWMFVPAVLFSAVTVCIAIEEEKYLLQRFGDEYREYLRSVRWRMIPGVF
jgi:protein-S-isoprenylcysteine O-methyltransferase Ste14